MNLDFGHGVRLRFGMGLDSGQGMDEEPLIGARRVGPRGLLGELERSLGLPSVEHVVSDRIARVQEELVLSGGDDPFWAVSVTVDPYAVAADVLQIRDELIMAGWDFVAGEGAPRRLRDISRLEGGPSVSGHAGGVRGERYGIADRYHAVISTLSAGDSRDRNPGIPGIAAIECAQRRATLPPAWNRLLTLLESAGLSVTEKPVGTDGEHRDMTGNRERLLAILNPDTDDPDRIGDTDGQDWPVLLDHERSVFIVRGGTVAEYTQHLARGSFAIPMYDGRQAIIAPRGSASLAAAFANAGYPRPRAGADTGIPAVTALVRALPAFLFDPIDVERLAEFFSVRPNPLGSSIARRLLGALQDRPGTGSPRWNKTVTELDDTQRATYDRWFSLDRVPDGTLCPALTATLPFENLATWAQRMAHVPGDSPVEWRSLESSCRRIAREIAATFEEGISRLQLEQLIRRMTHGEHGVRAEAGAVPVFTSPDELDAPVDTLVWLPFCETGATGATLYQWLRDDERRWLAERGVHVDTPEELSARHRAEVARAVAMARTVWLVVPEHHDGEPLTPHPVYRFLAARQDSSDFTHAPENILGELPEIPSAAPPEMPDQWRFNEIPGDALERSISFSRLNTLLTAPHAWVAEYAARLTSPRGSNVPHGAHLYGILAHDLADAWFSRPDWYELSPADFTAWFATAFEPYVWANTAPLARMGRDAERAGVRAVAHDGILALDRLLRERSWRPRGAESDLTGTLAGNPVHGRADLLCTTSGGQQISVVLDLKWQGETRRLEEVESGTAWQLAFYAAISGAPPGEVEAGYFILDRRRLVALEAGEPMITTTAAMEELYLQRRRELAEGTVVLPEREELTAWDPYRFLVGWGS